MSIINPLSRELSAKIVYYGPGLSGKTTTLRYLHSAVRPEQRGELIALATEGDRTLFFDFLPIKIEKVQGLPLRLQLYTVPGQVFYAATRKLVLRGVDGVVFVADSQVAARDANRESLNDLRQNLKEHGIDLAQFPHVLQYNKRDLQDILPVETLAADLNRHEMPQIESCAAEGEGVVLALREITRLVVDALNARQWAAGRSSRTTEAPRPPHDTDSISSSLVALAELPRPARATPAAPSEDLSFASLWPTSFQGAVTMVEEHIRRRQWSEATRAAAGALAELLRWMPGATHSDGSIGKALLLGLDGREYLRLCRLASAPEASITQADALFGLYLLVAARVKSGSA